MSTGTPHILLGAGGGIIPGSNPEDVASLLKHIQTLPTPMYGIDTAAVYPATNPGHSEKVLGEAHVGNTTLVLDTKILVGQTVDSSHGGPLSKVNLRNSVERSLAALKVSKVRIIYAHSPDTATPAAEAVAGFGTILNEGKAEAWGISNFSIDMVAEYIAEAERQGVPKPALYQGQYNPVTRGMEGDLLPLLRKHGIRFYAYSPTAGGFLSNKVVISNGSDLPSRFQPDHRASSRLNERFNNPRILVALQSLHKVAESHKIDVLSASLRWLVYHSPLGSGDGIILGASKVEQIEDSSAAIAKGRLPDDVVVGFQKLWENVNSNAPSD